MAKTNPLSEASMEEMLASIRGIIWSNKPKGPDKTSETELTSVDDPSTDNVSRLFGGEPAKPAARPPEPAVNSDEDAVSLELGEKSLDEVSDLISGDAHTIENDEMLDGNDDSPGEIEDTAQSAGDETDQPVQVENLSAAIAERETAPEDSQPDEWLLSPPADAGVADAFGQLASTMLPNNSRTVGQMAEEMMRPMLKEWLDENLPSLVERLVREEIERVSRRR
jgi:uncharacterized protein